MTTKHAPATPLPWQMLVHGEGVSYYARHEHDGRWYIQFRTASRCERTGDPSGYATLGDAKSAASTYCSP